MRGSVLSFLVLLPALSLQNRAQDVVSASSGVLQYFEGAVTINGNPVEHKTAVFPSLSNGAVIRTEKGRAELLLTPGVYLRLDENSAMKMVSNSLSDTRIDLTQGSAILDSLNAASTDPLLITYESSEVRFPKPGIYRLDSDVGELQAYSGEASVKHHGNSTTVDAEHRYYFDLDMTTNKSADSATDEFYDWASNRSNVIADQGQMASAEQADAQDADPGLGLGGFSGIPPVAPGIYSANSAPGAMPSLAYSNYASLNSPFYIYQPYPMFASAINLFVLPPLRTRPILGGSGYRPIPIINRWPAPVHSPVLSLSHPPIGGYSVSRPASVISMPHPVVSHPAISRPAMVMPHVTAIGHR